MSKQAYDDFCEYCVKGLLLVAMVLCISMLCVAIVHVIMRYAFNDALTWSEEFLRFTMVWFTLMSAAILHHYKGHVGIIIFRDMFPDKLRALCVRLIPVIAVAVTATVTVNGVILLFKTYKQMTPALNISVAIPYAAIPAGFFFMTLFGISHVLEITFGDSIPERESISGGSKE